MKKYTHNGIELTTQNGGILHPVTNILYPLNWTEMDDIVIEDLPEPQPEQPSPLEQLLQQAEAVRLALIDAVQARFALVQQGIGSFFQSSAEFKTFAGFTNAFQAHAQQFGAWEAEVWHQANVYKLQVLAGQAPMLTPEQAVAMMPAYPLA